MKYIEFQSEHFEKIDKELPSCLKNMVIEENVITNEAVCIKAVTNPDSQPVTLGTYTLYWKRLLSITEYSKIYIILLILLIYSIL